MGSCTDGQNNLAVLTFPRPRAASLSPFRVSRTQSPSITKVRSARYFLLCLMASHALSLTGFAPHSLRTPYRRSEVSRPRRHPQEFALTYMREELCNTRLCAYAYVGYKRPGFVCGTPLHGPRDGEYTLALRSRCATLIGSLRRQHEGKFTDRKLRIDAQRIAATQASPANMPLRSRRGAARYVVCRPVTPLSPLTDQLRQGPRDHSRRSRSTAHPEPSARAARRARCSGPVAHQRSGASSRRSPPGDHTWSHACINLGSAYAVQGTQHQESGCAIRRAPAVTAFSRIARATAAYGAQGDFRVFCSSPPSGCGR